MSRLLALIVLCGMWISVSSEDYLMNCIFNFTAFDPEDYTDDTLYDFSIYYYDLNTYELEEGGATYYYLAGPVETLGKVDKSIQVTYEIRDDGYIVAKGTYDACEFQKIIYEPYLMPILGNRDPVRQENVICGRKPGNPFIPKASKAADLVSKSKLYEGKYWIQFILWKGRDIVGGMTAKFNLIRVD